MTASTDTKTRKCLACGRMLRSAEAIARGYGSGCWSKIRKAQRNADLTPWTDGQVTEARQALADGAVVPSTREGVFLVVSSDGSEVYRATRHACNCANGLKTSQPRGCWHRCAVTIVSPAPAAPARTVLALPAAPAPAVPDVWERLGAMGALDLIPAF